MEYLQIILVNNDYRLIKQKTVYGWQYVLYSGALVYDSHSVFNSELWLARVKEKYF